MFSTTRSLASLSIALLSSALLTAPAAAAPGKPCKVQANPRSQTQILLTWEDTADNESGFRIDARTGSAPFVHIGDVPANTTSAIITQLTPGTKYEFRMRSFNAGSASAFSEVAAAFSDTTASTLPCSPTGNAICLNGNRFRVQATWRTASTTGNGVGSELADDSGVFYFFQPDNLEVLVKVLNACGLNNRYWVFFGATTNVEFTLVVTDTQTGTVRRYFNPLGRPALPLQDTSAFATCP